MINPFYFIVDKLQLLDRKSLQNISFVFLFSTLIILAGIHFLFTWKMKTAIMQVENLNNKRKSLERLLMRKSIAIAEKNKMEAIISKDPYFRIKEYCWQIIRTLHLENHVQKTQSESISEQPLGPTYSEILLSGSLQNLSTAQLISFLVQVESNQRVYLKELKIVNTSEQGVNLTYTLAALKFSKENDKGL